MRAWRIFGHCARLATHRLVVLLVPVMALAWFGLAAAPPLEGAGADAAAAAGLWLHLPGALLAFAAVVIALEVWPLLSRDRAGSAALLRLCPPAVDGCLPACAGVLCGLGLALAAAAVLFAGILGLQGFPSGEVRAHAPFAAADSRPLLDAGRTSLRFTTDSRRPLQAIALRPIAAWDAARDYRPVRLRVSAGGEPLHEGWLQVEGSHERLEIAFAPRELAEIEIAAESGEGLVLAFAPGSVEGVLTGDRSPLLNGVFAAVSYLLPAALALALACLLRRVLSFPVALLASTGTVVLTAVFETMPSGPALTAYASRRWLPSENLLAMLGDSLCMVAVVTLVAVVTTPRRRP